MKKLLLSILTIILLLSSVLLISCGEAATTTTADVTTTTADNTNITDITTISKKVIKIKGTIYSQDLIVIENEETVDKIFKIMDSAEWNDGKTKTSCDFLIILDDHTMYYYCSTTGLVEDRTLYPVNNTAKYFYLNDEQREFINSLTTSPNPGGDSAINGDAKYLDLIYETDRMWSNGYTYNRNVIQSAPQHLIDGSAEQKVTVKINGAQKELQYLESLYYPVPDRTYHIYLVSGEEGEKVYLDENGDVCYIEGDFTTVNISKTAAPEDVLPLLKEAIKDYADVSYYKNVKMPDDKSQNASGFGSYNFYFYNTADDYRTDWLRVTVNDDGTVKSLRINNLKYSVTSLNIVKSLENKMLDLKVNDMYTTLFTEPESYKLSDRVSEPVEVIIRNGEVYIQYTLCIEYNHIIDGKGEDDYIDIIVPLDIIDADN